MFFDYLIIGVAQKLAELQLTEITQKYVYFDEKLNILGQKIISAQVTKFQNDVFLRVFDLCQRLLVQKTSIFYEKKVRQHLVNI